MCFSPEADLVSGVLVSGVGVDTVRHQRCPGGLPLASIPLVLGGHQLVEAVVWQGLAGKVPALVTGVATWAYLLIAFVVVPVLVPWAVMAGEPDESRRRRMTAFVALGVLVAATLLSAMVRGPVTAELGHLHVAYHIQVPAGGVMVALYVAATCIRLLLSSYRHVNVFGVLNLAVGVVLAYTIPNGYTSLWCLWAAVSSGAIAAHLRHTQRRPRSTLRAGPGRPQPAEAPSG